MTPSCDRNWDQAPRTLPHVTSASSIIYVLQRPLGTVIIQYFKYPEVANHAMFGNNTDNCLTVTPSEIWQAFYATWGHTRNV